MCNKLTTDLNSIPAEDGIATAKAGAVGTSVRFDTRNDGGKVTVGVASAGT